MALSSEKDCLAWPTVVLFITSHSSTEYATKVLKLRAADFIAKPVHLEICRLRVKNQMMIKRQGWALSKAFKRLHREKVHLHTILNSTGDGY